MQDSHDVQFELEDSRDVHSILNLKQSGVHQLKFFEVLVSYSTVTPGMGFELSGIQQACANTELYSSTRIFSWSVLTTFATTDVMFSNLFFKKAKKIKTVVQRENSLAFPIRATPFSDSNCEQP